MKVTGASKAALREATRRLVSASAENVGQLDREEDCDEGGRRLSCAGG